MTDDASQECTQPTGPSARRLARDFAQLRDAVAALAGSISDMSHLRADVLRSNADVLRSNAETRRRLIINGVADFLVVASLVTFALMHWR